MGDWKHPDGKPYYYNSHHGRWMRRPRRSRRPSTDEALRAASSYARSTQSEVERLRETEADQREAVRIARAHAETLGGRGKREAKQAVVQAERLLRQTEERTREASWRADDTANRLVDAEGDHTARLRQRGQP